MTGSPAIFDLWQKLAYPLNLSFRPEMQRLAAYLNGLRGGYFAADDITGQGARTNPEFLGRLPCGESLHMWGSVPDMEEDVKPDESPLDAINLPPPHHLTTQANEDRICDPLPGLRYPSLR